MLLFADNVINNNNQQNIINNIVQRGGGNSNGGGASDGGAGNNGGWGSIAPVLPPAEPAPVPPPVKCEIFVPKDAMDKDKSCPAALKTYTQVSDRLLLWRELDRDAPDYVS